MKKIFFFLTGILICSISFGQDNKTMIVKACTDYLDGFYQGDTAKLISCLNPELYKFGYLRNKETGKYDPYGQMTWRQAIDYSGRVLAKKNFAKTDAPKKVEVLDIMHAIAVAKITAWWGVDYILLSKHAETWIIDQVLWEGPLQQ